MTTPSARRGPPYCLLLLLAVLDRSHALVSVPQTVSPLLQALEPGSHVLAPTTWSASQNLALERGASNALIEQAPQTVTQESWFQRLGDSLSEFVLGLVLIVFSVPLLWFNESRNAQMEALLALGKSEARTVSGKKAEPGNTNSLVHLKGEEMRAAAGVEDKRFSVSMSSSCVSLRSHAEVYQLIEESHKKEKEKLGGGKETITTYTYKEEWSSMWHDSNKYHDPSKRNVNKKPASLRLGTEVIPCRRVEIGEGFLLSEDLVRSCSNFQPIGDQVGQTIRLRDGGLTLRKESLGYFYSGSGTGYARIGDVRVRFEYVPDGPTSVIALQTEVAGENRASFLPYRLIRRPMFCGMSDDAKKAALRMQAEKSAGQLASEAGCSGWLACLCCPCNLVMKCFSSLLTPEIYHILNGSKDLDQCIQHISMSNTAMKWVFRVLGWLCMFAGLYMLFSPFLTLITVLPWIGPFLAKLGGGLIWFLCLVTTALISTTIVTLAYLFYHPLLAIFYAAAGVAVFVASSALLGWLGST